MTTLDQNVEMLRRRIAPLEMSADEFRQVGHRLVNTIADELARLRSRPVTPAESPQAVRQVVGAADLPETGTNAAALFNEITGQLFEHSLFNPDFRFSCGALAA